MAGGEGFTLAFPSVSINIIFSCISWTYEGYRIHVFPNASFRLVRQLGRQLGRDMVIEPKICYKVSRKK